MIHPVQGRVPGLLVAHAALAAELKSTAESIAGPAPDLPCLSNRDLSPDELAEAIGLALDASGAGTIVLVDLAGGSCLAAVQRACRGRSGVSVVAGVNLPLILDFLQKRDVLPFDQLVIHLLERGHSGLKIVPAGGPTA